MTEWQPIETAPRNGKWILVTGFHNKKRGPVSHITAVAGWFPKNRDKPDGEHAWFYGTQGDETLRDPTHWMEIPHVPPEVRRSPIRNVEVVVFSRRSGSRIRERKAKNPVTVEEPK